jgi:hypothetical protein
VGFSNTAQIFNGFMQAAQTDREVNPKVVLVNGAVGGMSANMIQNPDDNGRGTKYWTTVDERLKAAGVTRAQVQVVWIKETNTARMIAKFRHPNNRWFVGLQEYVHGLTGGWQGTKSNPATSVRAQPVRITPSEVVVAFVLAAVPILSASSFTDCASTNANQLVARTAASSCWVANR